MAELRVGNHLVFKKKRVAKTYRPLGLRIVEYVGKKDALIALKWYDGDITMDSPIDIDWETTGLLWKYWGKPYPHKDWNRMQPFGALSLKQARRSYGKK